MTGDNDNDKIRKDGMYIPSGGAFLLRFVELCKKVLVRDTIRPVHGKRFVNQMRFVKNYDKSGYVSTL